MQACRSSAGYAHDRSAGGNRDFRCTRATPVLDDVSHVSVGYGQVCAILDTGYTTCWGLDDYGQIGSGAANGDSCGPAMLS
jgi:alpha-tubulin suppressor-like RCC1 family protein